jgi:type II secretory pathway pseudopilin PulG
MRVRALALVEIVVAVMIIITVLVAYFSLTQTTIRSVGQSRNYVLATIAAENAIEELLAHRYGTPMSPDRLKFEPRIILEGRLGQPKFEVKAKPIKEAGGDGSIFGDGRGDFDVLDVVVSWREPEPSGAGTREQTLEFELVVRRKYEL